MSAPVSLVRRRMGKFRRLRRGYYSFLLITGGYLLSFFLPLIANNVPLAVKYRGEYFFPLLTYHAAPEFGQNEIGRAHV